MAPLFCIKNVRIAIVFVEFDLQVCGFYDITGFR